MLISKNYETLQVDSPENHILKVTLDRPESANALNTRMGLELLEVFSSIILDVQDFRCIIITACGDRFFCAGGDLKERNKMTDEDWEKQHKIFEQAFYSIMDCPIPVISSVNGVAYGGGCELALSADFIYASQTAKFALTEPRLGIIPGGGGTQNLPRAVGIRRAKEIILSTQPFSANEAEAWGMVNKVTSQENLVEATLETAKLISKNAPIAVRQAKRSMNLGYETDIKTGLGVEIECYNRTISTSDRREGVAAFNEKRPPIFLGK